MMTWLEHNYAPSMRRKTRNQIHAATLAQQRTALIAHT